MDDEALKRSLGFIVAQEDRPDADWDIIARLCDELADEIGIDAPLPVQEYLATTERRRTDAVFAQAQRSELIRYLRGVTKKN